MPKVLNAENAQIITATVTVRALTIERRQVTLSVFRQLIEADIVDLDVMRLRGVGWGHVRYLIEQPPDRAINLVWQLGSELRRGIVQRYQDRWTLLYKQQRNIAVRECDSDQRDARGRRCMAFRPQHAWPWRQIPRGRLYDPPDIPAPKSPERPPGWMQDGSLLESSGYHVAYEAFSRLWKEYNARRVAHKEAAKEAYRQEVLDALQKEYDARCEWCDQYEALVAPLFDLPQLFIAA